MYKLQPIDEVRKIQAVIRLSDNAVIPFDPFNTDYQTYLKWLDGYEWKITGPMQMGWVKVSEGNTPLPPDVE